MYVCILQVHIYVRTVVWKSFGIKKISYGSLVTKFKHTNIIPLQNFSYEIYLHFLFSRPFSEHVLAISIICDITLGRDD